MPSTFEVPTYESTQTQTGDELTRYIKSYRWALHITEQHDATELPVGALQQAEMRLDSSIALQRALSVPEAKSFRNVDEAMVNRLRNRIRSGSREFQAGEILAKAGIPQIVIERLQK